MWSRSFRDFLALRALARNYGIYEFLPLFFALAQVLGVEEWKDGIGLQLGCV